MKQLVKSSFWAAGGGGRKWRPERPVSQGGLANIFGREGKSQSSEELSSKCWSHSKISLLLQVNWIYWEPCASLQNSLSAGTRRHNSRMLNLLHYLVWGRFPITLLKVICRKIWYEGIKKVSWRQAGTEASNWIARWPCTSRNALCYSLLQL